MVWKYQINYEPGQKSSPKDRFSEVRTNKLFLFDNVRLLSMQENEDAKLDLRLFEMYFYENETK